MQLYCFRKKAGNAQGDSVLAQSIDSGLALEFERSDSTRRLRLVLCELLFIASQVRFFLIFILTMRMYFKLNFFLPGSGIPKK